MFKAIGEFFGLNVSPNEYISFSGDYEFFLDVDILQELPFHTASVNIKAYASSSKETPISITVDWFRIIGDQIIPIKNTPGTIYNANPYDIGCIVRGAVKSSTGASEGVAFVEIGPFQIDPAVKPFIEDSLLSRRAGFNFRLIAYDDIYIEDNSDFANTIRIDGDIFSINYSEGLEIYPDFAVDMSRPKMFRVKVIADDPRCLVVMYRQSTIIKNDPFTKSVPRLPLDSMSAQSKPETPRKERLSKALANSIYIMGMEPGRVDLEDLEMVKIEIKMESQILRDAFLASLRLNVLSEGLPLRKLLDSVDYIIRKEIFPIQYDENTNQYQKALFQLSSFRETLRKMLNVNRNLNYENDTINDCIEILRNDISILITEFDKISKIMLDQPENEKRVFHVLEKSLHETSMQLNKMQDESLQSRPYIKKSNQIIEERDRINKLQNELESKKRFNELLSKEIVKLQSTTLAPVNPRSRALDATHIAGTAHIHREQDPRQNRSQIIGSKKQNDYLNNLGHQHPPKSEEEKTATKMEALLKEEIEIAQKNYEELLSMLAAISEGESTNSLQEFKNLLRNVTDNKIHRIEDIDDGLLEKEVQTLREHLNKILNEELSPPQQEPSPEAFVTFQRPDDMGVSTLSNAFGDLRDLKIIDNLQSEKETLERQLITLKSTVLNYDVLADMVIPYERRNRSLETELQKLRDELSALKSENENFKNVPKAISADVEHDIQDQDKPHEAEEIELSNPSNIDSTPIKNPEPHFESSPEKISKEGHRETEKLVEAVELKSSENQQTPDIEVYELQEETDKEESLIASELQNVEKATKHQKEDEIYQVQKDNLDESEEIKVDSQVENHDNDISEEYMSVESNKGEENRDEQDECNIDESQKETTPYKELIKTPEPAKDDLEKSEGLSKSNSKVI